MSDNEEIDMHANRIGSVQDYLYYKLWLDMLKKTCTWTGYTDCENENEKEEL